MRDLRRSAFMLALVLGLSLLLSGYTGKRRPEYETSLFDTGRVHTVDVEISEDDWQDLLAHAEDKTKYETSVTIDGERTERVAFSAKGNSSLAFVKYSGVSSRYSFKLNFGKYVKGQTWRGLDKLNLQNGIADASYMKEYLSYELMRKAGVPTPLCSYVFLRINGEPYGLYLAVEEPEDSFIARTLEDGGFLYKPQWPEKELDEARINALFEGESAKAESGCGSELLYLGDDPESYPDIFENNVTKRSPESELRVIAALKALNEEENLEAALDTAEIIRYFAAHNFLMNYDGYTGPMLHNYYIYEHNGRLQVLPWDYNLAFGAFSVEGRVTHANDPGFVVNQGIDTPLVNTDLSARPMWRWIVSDEDYLALYHHWLQRLIRRQFDSGDFVREADRVYEMIRPYIAEDPTAFYTVEETDLAYDTLRELLLLRAESVRRQLNGTLAAETDRQIPSRRVDTAVIDLTRLGSFDLRG